MENKIKGALFGFAIGDAMGATTEFLSQFEIRRKYGIVDDIIGGGWLNLNAGDITDDTQMMLCVCDALQEIFPPDEPIITAEREMYYLRKFKEITMKNFVAWLKSGPLDVGNACRDSIYYYIKNRQYIGYDKNKLGNGGLMRFLPCALLGLQDFNVAQNNLTHRNELCQNNILVAHTVINILLGNMVVFGEELNIDDFIFDKGRQLMTPTGHITNTLNNALYWFQNAARFEDCILEPVNHGGDADTIAAITGSFGGAKYGYDSIPKKWLEKIDKKVAARLENFSKFVLDYWEAM